MFSSIFSKTFYEKRWVMVAWFVGMMFMAWLTMIFYPVLKTSFGTTLSNIPQSLQTVLGNANSYKTVPGYVSTQIFALRMPMFALVMAISIFIGLSAGDEERGTLESLLAQPVSRAQVFWHKFGAGAALTAVASVGIWLGVVASFPFIHGTMSLWDLALASFACWLVGLAFGAITYGLGALLGRKGLAIGIASALAFFSYLLTSLAPSVDKLQQVQKVSLFYYYNTPEVATNGLRLTNILVLLAVIIIFCVLGLFVFRHRDLRRD